MLSLKCLERVDKLIKIFAHHTILPTAQKLPNVSNVQLFYLPIGYKQTVVEQN
jgi:hypothetical protein